MSYMDVMLVVTGIAILAIPAAVIFAWFMSKPEGFGSDWIEGK